MAERILTLHPEGKTGVNIDAEKYDLVREAILDSVHAIEGITFTRLIEEVRSRLWDILDGSVEWYVTTVKLDLEARGEIERTATSPQKLKAMTRRH